MFRLFFLTLLFFSIKLGAQNNTQELLRVKFLYDDLRFEETISISDQILNQNVNLDPETLEFIYLYRSLAFYNLSQIDSARSGFLTLLSVNPSFTLNPIETSPKIIEFFSTIKENLWSFGRNNKVVPFKSYIFIEDQRSGAAWRSAVLPGWGQYYKNQKSKAKYLGVAFYASGLLTLSAYYFEYKYHNEYLDETVPSLITKKYDKYNTWHKTRKAGIYLTGILWLINFADALWTPSSKINAETDFSSSLILNLSVPLK